MSVFPIKSRNRLDFVIKGHLCTLRYKLYFIHDMLVVKLHRTNTLVISNYSAPVIILPWEIVTYLYVSHQNTRLSCVTISDVLDPWQITCQSFSTHWSQLGFTDLPERVRKCTDWKWIQSHVPDLILLESTLTREKELMKKCLIHERLRQLSWLQVFGPK